LTRDAINIAVPVTIHVEDWFNADMDVKIKLSVTGCSGCGPGHQVMEWMNIERKEEWHAVRETHAKPIELRSSQLILGRHALIHPLFEDAQALGGPPLIARHVS
jgi:hypothetical protein